MIFLIGLLSIVSGTYGVYQDKDLFGAAMGILIGVALVGSIYFDKPPKKKQSKQN